MRLKTTFKELIPILARTDPMFRDPPTRRPTPKADAPAEVVKRIQEEVAELRTAQSELLRSQEELRAAVDALRARGAGG